MAFVIDASALIWATTEKAETLRARLRDETVHAPHLIDAEYGNVLRRKVHRAELSPKHAATLLATAPTLVDLRYEHRGPLAAHAWTLGENVTFYDALYVALASALDLGLVTADGRLARAPNLPCIVEMVR